MDIPETPRPLPATYESMQKAVEGIQTAASAYREEIFKTEGINATDLVSLMQNDRPKVDRLMASIATEARIHRAARLRGKAINEAERDYPEASDPVKRVEMELAYKWVCIKEGGKRLEEILPSIVDDLTTVNKVPEQEIRELLTSDQPIKRWSITELYRNAVVLGEAPTDPEKMREFIAEKFEV